MAHRSEHLHDGGRYQWVPLESDAGHSERDGVFVMTGLDDEDGDMEEDEQDVQGEAENRVTTVGRQFCVSSLRLMKVPARAQRS